MISDTTLKFVKMVTSIDVSGLHMMQVDAPTFYIQPDQSKHSIEICGDDVVDAYSCFNA